MFDYSSILTLKFKKGNMLQCALWCFVPGRCTKTAGRTTALFVFPVTLKASRMIEAYRRDCCLIASLLSCGKGAIPTVRR